MAKRTCLECGAYNALESQCRRQAPTVLIINKPGEMQVHGAFPGTRPESWCAQWMDPALLEKPVGLVS